MMTLSKRDERLAELDFRDFASRECEALIKGLVLRHEAEMLSVQATRGLGSKNIRNEQRRIGQEETIPTFVPASLSLSEIRPEVAGTRPTSLGDLGPEVRPALSMDERSSGRQKLGTRFSDTNELDLEIDDPAASAFGSLSFHSISGLSAASSAISNESIESGELCQRSSTLTPGKSRLRVNIVSATALRDADKMIGQGISDPYCICRIPNKPATEFRTKTIANNLNPVWNHQGVIADYNDGDNLEFIVMDKDRFKEDDFLGRATLRSERFHTKGFSGIVKLSHGGTLRIKIAIELNDHAHIKELLRRSREMWPIVERPPSPAAGASLSKGSIARGTSFMSVQTVSRHSRSGPRPDPDVIDEANACAASSAISMDYCRDNMLKLGDEVHQDSVNKGCMSPFIFQPATKTRLLWDLIGLIFVAYDLAMIPFVAAFDIKVEHGLFIAIVIIAAFWTLDVISTFFTGVEQNGILEMRMHIIALRYIKTWFLVDVALVTIDWFYVVIIIVNLASAASVSKSFRLLKTMRSIRILRSFTMLRMWKLGKFLGAFLKQLQRPSMTAALQICEALVVLIALTHIVACIWYGLGTASSENITWTKDGRFTGTALAYRYTTSFHWALTQFTPASMDVSATNTKERTFTIIIDFLGLLAFSTFVSTITQKMTMIREIRNRTIDQDKKLAEFMEQQKLSLELGARLLKIHREKNCQVGERVPEQSISCLQGLPPTLEKQLHLEMYSPVLQYHPFFAQVYHMHSGLVRDLTATAMFTRICFEHEDVFIYGETATCMYFVKYGEYEYTRLGETIQLSAADWLGEPALWIQGWVHRGTFASSGHSEVGCLRADSFNKLVAQHEGSSRIIRFIACYAAEFVRKQIDLDEVEGAASASEEATPRRAQALKSLRQSRFDSARTQNTQNSLAGDLERQLGSATTVTTVRLSGLLQEMLQMSDIWGTFEDSYDMVQTVLVDTKVDTNASFGGAVSAKLAE